MADAERLTAANNPEQKKWESREYGRDPKHMKTSAQSEAILKANSLSEVRFDKEYFHLHLADGRILSIPFELVPSLSRATQKERENYLIESMGTAIHWPDIDEDLSVEGLILGRKIIDWRKKKQL